MKARILYDIENENKQKVCKGEVFEVEPLADRRGLGMGVVDESRKGFYLYPWEYERVEEVAFVPPW